MKFAEPGLQRNVVLYGNWNLQWVSELAIVTAILLLLTPSALAQRRPIADNTLGNERSIVTPHIINGREGDRIDGGAIRGENLFHSFQDFDVDEGRSVYFSNPSGIRTILSRVTGNTSSEILGTLGVLGNANLFLLNPNGIVFGPNARLDISGSFVASTGDRFVFPDGSEFSATNPQTAPLLTVNITPGLQYGTNSATLSNRGNLVVGQNLTLAASNLDLQGQLQAGRDLTLQAESVVQMRDTVAVPFTATSGNSLTIQGNQGIDILALNHPQSGIWSGGNLSLISDGAIVGDARFYSGGNWSIVTSAGTPTSFISEIDPVIYANGDVLFGDYTGAALKVEATGSIQGGNITITSPDCAAGSAGCVGGIPDTDPDFATLTGNRAVILRSGVGSSAGVNLPIADNTEFTSTLGLPPGIRVGNINTSDRTGSDGGNIILSAARGNILTAYLNSSSSESSGNGGEITLFTSDGDITTDSVESYSNSRFDSGNGGAINFSTSNGDIIVNGDLTSYSYSNEGNSRHGGAISLSTNNGSITTMGRLGSESVAASGISGDGGNISLIGSNDIFTTNNISSSSLSFSSSSSNGGEITLIAGGSITSKDIESRSNGAPDAANGGNISLIAGSSIFTNSLSSISYSLGVSRNGGAITLASASSSITAENINTLSHGLGPAGNGGNVLLAAPSGSVTAATINSQAEGYGGNGGAITINSGGDITTTTVSSQTQGLFGGNGGAITINSGGDITAGELNSGSTSQSLSNGGLRGNGGAITINSGGDIIAAIISSQTKGYGGDGGPITLRSFGNITLHDIVTSSSSSSSRTSPFYDEFAEVIQGQGGVIILEARGNITTDAISSQTFNRRAGALSENGGAITLNAGGNITALGEINSESLGGSTARNGGTIILNAGSSITTEDVISRAAALGSAGNGGNISLTTGGSISTHNLSSSSLSQGNSRNGGTITLTANGGDISTENISSISYSTYEEIGDGGAITLTADGGIFTGNLDSFTSRALRGILQRVVVGNGGAITLSANRGNIVINNLNSYSYSTNTDVGHGGSITLSTRNGSISGRDSSNVNSFSISENGIAQNGGDVVLEASGNITNLKILTLSPLRSGDVYLTGLANLSLNNTAILTSNQVNVFVPTVGKIELSIGGQGQSGNVTLTSLGNILVNNSHVESDTKGSDPAGNVTFNSAGIVTFNNSQVITNTSSTGQAGSVSIRADQGILIDPMSRLSAQATAQGNAGSISLSAPQLTLRSGASISTTTNSSGNAGNIKLKPRNSGQNLNVILQPNTEISAFTSDSGTGGRLTITAPNSVNIRGAGTLSAESRGSGDARIIYILSQQLVLDNGVQISASTSSTGEGGSLIVNAPTSVFLGNQGQLLTESTGSGRAGNLVINTRQLTLEEGAEISASNQFSAGGNINLNIDGSLRLNNNSQISASTQSGIGGNITIQDLDTLRILNSLISAESRTGRAGRLRVNASDSVLLDGRGNRRGGLSVQSRGGRAGELRVTTDELNIRDRAAVTVSSRQGNAGDLIVNADSVTLDNGSLTAIAGAGDGGNITVDASGDLLQLSDNSRISARALDQASGGNVTLNVLNGFVIANPFENSDIVASAIEGEGGRVDINALQIFGLVERTGDTPLSDINVSSTFGTSGTIELNTLNTNPTQGLAVLPENVAQSEQIDQRCATTSGGAGAQGTFVVSGRGGLPLNADESLSTDAVQVDLVTTEDEAEPSTDRPVSLPEIHTTDGTIVEAQGWVVAANGDVIFTTSTPRATPVHFQHTPTCVSEQREQQ